MSTLVGVNVRADGIQTDAFDVAGSTIASFETELIPPADPSDPEAVLASVLGCLHEISLEMGSPPRSMGISGDPERLVAWNRQTLAPLTPIVEKHNGTNETDPDSRKAEQLSLIIKHLGSASLADLVIGPLLSWLAGVLTQNTVPLVDWSSANQALPFDYHTGTYAREALQWHSLPPGVFPVPVKSNANFGTLSRAGLASFGRVTINAVLPERLAVLLGHGCLSRGKVLTLFDQNTVLLPPWNPENSTSGGKGGTQDRLRSAVEGFENLDFTAADISASSLISWMTESLAIAPDLGTLHLRASSARNSGQILVIPDYELRNDAMGQIVAGLDPSTSAPQIARAGFESVALQLDSILQRDLTSHEGAKLDSIRLAGQLSELDFVCQLIADQTNLVCDAADATHAATRGAALMSATGLGIVSPENLPPATIRKSFDPSPQRSGPNARRARWNRYLQKLDSTHQA